MRKPILIHADNQGAIDAWLSEVNGTARPHTFDTCVRVSAESFKAEARGIAFTGAKTHLIGAVYQVTSGSAVPNAYNYTRQATFLEMERKRKGGYLRKVERREIYKEGSRAFLILPETAAEALTRHRQSSGVYLASEREV